MCADSYTDHRLLSGGSHRGVLTALHEIFDCLADIGFARTKAPDVPGHERRAAAVTFQNGVHVAFVHHFHFAGYTRHDENFGAPTPGGNAWRGSAGIVDGIAAGWKHGLYGIGLRHVPAAGREKRADLLDPLRAEFQLYPHRRGQSLARQVVFRWPDPAA